MDIPVGYAQVNLRWTGTSLPTGAECTFGVDLSAFTTTPEDLCDVVEAAYVSSALASIQVNTVTLTSILAKFGPNVTGPSFLKGVSRTGLITSAGNWPATSLLVQKSTALGGRSGRGRWYWPGITEADVLNSGLVDAPYRAVAQTCFNDFQADLSTANVELVVLHGADAPLSTPTPITGLTVDNRVATQRRRNRR